jgi:hypothetical protein
VRTQVHRAWDRRYGADPPGLRRRARAILGHMIDGKLIARRTRDPASYRIVSDDGTGPVEIGSISERATLSATRSIGPLCASRQHYFLSGHR